jgi:hypothetical protein
MIDGMILRRIDSESSRVVSVESDGHPRKRSGSFRTYATHEDARALSTSRRHGAGVVYRRTGEVRAAHLLVAAPGGSSLSFCVRDLE